MIEEVSLQYYFERIGDTPFAAAFQNITYPWEALRRKDDRLFQFQKSTIKGTVHPTAVVTGLVQIGKGAVIGPHVVIEGPAMIGEQTLVRSHAFIRPFSAIGKDCVIGHGSEIKNVILMDEVKIASMCFVGDSILGFGARFGSMTVAENRRFDQKEVTFKVGEQVFQSGMDKMGCVMGDYARTGGSCLLAPGTLVGKYSWIYSNANVFGFVPKESVVKYRQALEIVPKDRLVLQRTDATGNV